MRQREHGEDAFQPVVRQAWGEAADAGGATWKRVPLDPIRRRPKVSFLPSSAKSPEGVTTNFLSSRENLQA